MLENEISSHERRRGDYLILIDKAIVQRRYALAVQLANRCLLQYYRIFLRQVQPKYTFRRTRTAYQMAVQLIKYLRKYPRKYNWFSTQERQYDLLSASFYIGMFLQRRKEKARIQLDRAAAVYARNHSLAITQHLMRFLKEKRTI